MDTLNNLRFRTVAAVFSIWAFSALVACGDEHSAAVPEVVETPFCSATLLPELESSSSSERNLELQPESSSSSERNLELQPESSSSLVPIPQSCSSMEPLSSSVQTSQSQQHVFYSKSIIGADISQMQEYEAKGVRVLDENGLPTDIFELLRDRGFNYIRLKTFVNPKAKYGYASAGCDQGTGTFAQDVEAFGDKEHVVTYAKRAKAVGFKLLLDFHYSDNWADPGKQIIPERWRGVTNSDVLADSIYAYTKDVLNALKAENALPDMVQLGNEITNGLLRDVPTSSTNCWGENIVLATDAVSGVMSNATGIANTAKYLAAGSRAVKEISNNIKTVFHIESPQKTSTVDWWMKSVIDNSHVSPDVMAFSAYTAYEHGTPDTWKQLFNNLASRYSNLEFLIAEYNGAPKGGDYSFDGSRVKTQLIMEQVPRGLGSFIWEPERSGAWGSALFDWVGNDLKANSKAFDEYQVFKIQVGNVNDMPRR